MGLKNSSVREKPNLIRLYLAHKKTPRLVGRGVSEFLKEYFIRLPNVEGGL